MAPSFWEKIFLAFRYNDSIWHNVFLTIIYILIALSLLALIRGIMRTIAQPRDIRDEAPRPKFSKRLSGWFLGSLAGLAFPVILFLVLTLALGSSDSATISSSKLSYEYKGMQTSVVLIDKFIANSSERGITTGSSKSYVYALNEETGEPIWKKGIGRAYAPYLMGQTEERIVVFDGSGPLILNKSDGSEAADIGKMESSNAELQGQFPEESNSYAWDEKRQMIVFRGLDGGLYFIRPDTLKGGASSSKLSDYFKNDESENVYVSDRLSIVPSGQKDGKYRFFANEETAQQLRDGTFAQEESPNASSDAQDMRRRIYAGSLLADGEVAVKDLEPLIDQVFLRGAFLSDLRRDAADSNDPYKLTGFPDYSSIKKEPAMPDSPESIDWPSRMTIEQYESYKAEENRRIDEYYAERDAYDAANKSYRENETMYDNIARSLLIQNGGTPVPPFHYTETSGGHEVFLVAHYSSLAADANLLISAVDLEGATVLWTADTHLKDVESYTPSDGRMMFAGRGNDGNSYMFSLSLKDGSGWGYDFRYDRELAF